MAEHFHERFDRPELPPPSDRSTGLVLAAALAVVAYLWRANSIVLTVALAAAILLAVVSLLLPSALRPLNIAWMRFAVLLSKVMNPIVMFILFAIAIVPAGLIMQLLRDPLRKRRRNQSSYWIAVSQNERLSQSNMKNQF